MSSGLYTPLLLIGILYAGLSIAAGVVARRGDHARGERMRDLGFGTALIAAAYTVILLILAAIDAPSRFTDAITIIVVVLAFFGLLLFVLFAMSEAVARIRGRTGS
jgi:hypothetical protein